MKDLYDTFETVLFGGFVLCAIGVVVYLAYLQYVKVKRRRSHRRHRAHRAMRQSNGPAGEHRPSHTPRPEESGLANRTARQPGRRAPGTR